MLASSSISFGGERRAIGILYVCRGELEQVGWRDNLARRTNWLVPRCAGSNHIGQFVRMMEACMPAAGISCGLGNGGVGDRLGVVAKVASFLALWSGSGVC